MKVFMTGGSGFVGSTLTRHLLHLGHEVTLLSRSPSAEKAPVSGLRHLHGDPTAPGPWQEEVGRHDVLINLAGASIFRRWTPKAKEAIRESRLLTTRHLVAPLEGAKDPKTRLLLSTSAVGYYGFCGDDERVEESSPGTDFLAGVARDWEAEALRAEQWGIRVVLCRLGIVLGKKGGALRMMLPLYRFGLGSPLGSGEQWFSWIHQEDLARVYLFLMEEEGIQGAVNCAAPEPVRNREFSRILARILKKPAPLPYTPRFMVRMIMGEFGETLLNGQRVFPRKLLDQGFRFSFPRIREALEDLLAA